MSAADNVLGAALAGGIALPHSCRAGRCASCKARLVSGEIVYPDDRLPPGIVAAEAARGEVLLCQARPRSNLVIESRRTSGRDAQFVECVLSSLRKPAPGTLRATIRIPGDVMTVRPGQYVDLKDPLGFIERVVVLAVSGSELELEFDRDGPLGECLSTSASGTKLGISGPFETLR